jgi:RNA polymerase sigma-70 factor (ECF subfamily)
MTTPTASAIQLSALVMIAAAATADASRIEQEVLVLFDRFRDPLLRYVCGFGIAVRDGEDVVQDVFLALFRHLTRDGSRSNLQGWLFRVAHNLALKHAGRQRRRLARVVSVESAYDRPDPSPDVEQDLVRRQQHTQLLAVLEALPERDRHCVRLRVEGLKYRDIAQVLGISLGAVSKSLTRAIGRFGRVLGR